MVGKFQVLESQPSSGDSVRQALISAAPQQVNWTRLEPDNGSVDGPMIMVGQNCAEEGGDTEEVDVTVTEVDVTVTEVDGTLTEVVTVTEEDITHKA